MRWHRPGISYLCALKPYFLCKPFTITKCTNRSSSITVMAMKSIGESDVGILSYISSLPGFRGILKQRYSDFIVNEVDTDGNVVHLTSLDAPPEIVSESKPMKGHGTSESYASEIELFRSLAGASDAEILEAFLKQISSGVDDSISPIVFSPDTDKSHRTAVHNFFKKFNFLVTDTVDGPDSSSKCVRVRVDSGLQNNRGRVSKKRKERGDKPFDSRGSDNWPEHVGKFLRFHLYKENKDTQEALGLIGKMLGIQTRSFGFAGTKDKRAITTQRVTVFKQHASRLAALNDRLIGIKLGNFSYIQEGLLLGQLLGNRFTITLRGVVADSEDTIKTSAEALGRLGFINYFGLQRFGSGSVPTHLVGASLLRGEWKGAVNMILDPREGETNVIAEARNYYKESNDIDGTLKQLPRYLVAERAILQCLKKCPGNYLQALKAIPRTLRMMYVHSYQSYLWNHAASMRVQKYGIDKVVVGDLVYCKENHTATAAVQKSEENVDEDCGDANTYDSCHLEEICTLDLPTERNKHVKAVSAEDVQSGNFTIDDVVLPLPGSRVIYPTNDIAEVYHDLAAKDSINLTETIHNVKEFSITNMTGSYRSVFQRPKDYEWELISYVDRNLPLAESDLDNLLKSLSVEITKEEKMHDKSKDEDSLDSTEQSGSCKKSNKLQANENENGEAAQDPQMALKLSFNLPTSSYATMAIRELLKTSTSVAFHKALNE
ncbi:multisubstrate pseudouridine synthase 7 isoform X1 [Cucurbita maxima]|uniref:Multisubstrate pseudouridine synthase 7 isoform X1 n=2 Tax=Cucurbita maxima TaxID=3661 RepID=A0A6J1KMR0_CUCMA|nr:multisubstrate pseudouridine synthase 7 isoform X1 [Cucurbita maxima]XP_023002013.1 multisubstrate pseudouridine synthase 7 isoform X1 [Cucurbita maxima]